MYSVIALPILLGVCSLAVDYGMVVLTKSELQAGADAAARYAVGGFDSGGPAAVRARLTQALADNRSSAKNANLAGRANLQFGVWDAANRTFTAVPAAEEASASAVRVTIEFKQSDGSSLTLPFARAIGKGHQDIIRSCVATRGATVSPTISGMACPWLAGMPNGAYVYNTNGNPKATKGPEFHPNEIPLSKFHAGDALRFRQTTGTTSMIGYEDLPLDGKASWVVTQIAANGINQTSAPIGALMGIFLDDNAPHTTAQNAPLDYSTPASRNFVTATPGLKQVFFIGDGLTADGRLQEFVPPPGAKRLFLGIMDESGWWWDNTGSIHTNTFDETIRIVK